MDTIRIAEQVRAFNAQYAACIDDDKLESWPDFFIERCLYKITTAQNVEEGLPAGLMYADSQGMLRDRISALREANIYESQRYRHIVSLSHIQPQDDMLHVQTPFLVVRTMRGGGPELFVSGRYDDCMVQHEDAWKLSQRIVICDSVSIDTLLAIPL